MIPQLKNNPLVTVAMVTYNSSKYVRVAIESVLASTYENFELIISDDCSTDNTWEIINEYNDLRIRKYRNEENINEYPNRNRCIDLAKGKYFIFIDGDDYIYPHGLEFMTKMMENNPDCSYAIMSEYRNNLIYPIKLSPTLFYNCEFNKVGFLNHAFANMYFKTNEVRRIGGIPTNYRAGDTILCYILSQEGTCLIINDSLTWWRETPNQAFQRLTKDPASFLEMNELLTFVLSSNKCPLNRKDINIYLDNLLKVAVRFLLKNLLKLKFKHSFFAYQFLKRYRLKLSHFTNKPIYTNPFENYTSQFPFIKNN